jgi:hypothetical protein
MSANVGTFDRLLRLVIGLLLVVAPFVTTYGIWDNEIIKYAAITVGAVLAVTAVTSVCPLYSLLGIRTCRISRA